MSWLNHAVMYQIFIDRFAGYDEEKDWQQPDYLGGTLRGIIEKFDYIRSLGVNTIWLSPFYRGSAYHGYEISDFFSVDEHFGTEQDLQELIDLAHSHNIRVIADMVPNHVSYLHPYFADARHNTDSPYRDWFYFDKDNSYVGFLTHKNMAKLKLDNPDAMDYMISSARKWLAMGLDGYRVDHIIGLSNQNVKDLFGPLKAEFPDAAFFGEASLFGPEGDPLGSRMSYEGLSTVRVPKKRRLWLFRKRALTAMNNSYVGLLDGMLDFYGAYQFVQLARSNSSHTAKRVQKKLQRHARRYPDHFSLVYFFDNHDLNRYLFVAGGDKQKLLTALSIMFSLPGAKVIYYGTEVGLSQDKNFTDLPSHGDMQARRPMPWREDEQDSELLAAVRSIIASRK